MLLTLPPNLWRARCWLDMAILLDMAVLLDWQPPETGASNRGHGM